MAKVIVYSTSTCPYCTMAEDFLKENSIEFEAYNVSQDQEKGREMIEKSGQSGVPVLDINGKIIIGFDVTKIKAVLKLE